MHRLLLLLILLASVAAGPVMAQPLTDAEKKEFEQNLALPSPAEMFLAVDRLADAEWGKVAGSSPRYDYTDNYARALNLGVRAADGLVAILAEDKARLGDVITVVITLAEELQVEDAVLERSSTFEELANMERWAELRDELNTLRYMIEMEMDQIGDQDVVVLVRAGGWLEGLTATAELLRGQGYPASVTSILYQPALVDYFAQELAGLEPEAKKHPMVQALAKALPAIRKLVNVGYGQPVPAENIEQLHRLGSALLATIQEG